jgi:hypothetical protein
MDNRGTALIDFLHQLAATLSAESDDHLKAIRCDSAHLIGNELRLLVRHGQKGVVADILDSAGNRAFRQKAEHQHSVRCAALFMLPRTARRGWLAAHVNNGRGVKGLLEKGIQREFRQQFEDLVLQITPFILDSALKKAVEQDRIDKIKLVRHELATDRAVRDTDKWVPRGTEAVLELSITARGRARMIGERIRQFLDRRDPSTFESIVKFEGIRFDEAKVEVVLEGNQRRTFNIEKPDAGHAMTIDLDPLPTDADGEPEIEALFAALHRTLTSVAAER